MVFDAIAVGLLVGVWWIMWRPRAVELDPSLMPVEDRPPEDVDLYRVPRLRLRRYVNEGVEDIEYWLSGFDQAA